MFTGRDKLKSREREMTMLTHTLQIIKHKAVLLCVLLLLSGCATMFAPDSDTITIKTEPAGADVYDGANLLGKTPFTHSFKRVALERKILLIKKEGYVSEELNLRKSLETTALWNIAFVLTTGGVTSWAIDAHSGNMTKYSPDSYLIELEKKGKAVSRAEHLRLQRIRFVLLNRDSLMKDIAAGDGNYLRTYFEMRPHQQPLDTYQAFLKHVSGQAPHLLCQNDPIEFYHQLEKQTPETR
jgi:hypothetical protein